MNNLLIYENTKYYVADVIFNLNSDTVDIKLIEVEKLSNTLAETERINNMTLLKRGKAIKVLIPT